jgi:hypothetical protein
LKAIDSPGLTLFRALLTEGNPAALTKVLCLTIRVILALHPRAPESQMDFSKKTSSSCIYAKPAAQSRKNKLSE